MLRDPRGFTVGLEHSIGTKLARGVPAIDPWLAGVNPLLKAPLNALAAET